MNRQQGGMVLLTTVMIMVMLTLLVVSLMQGVFLYIQSSHQLIANHQSLRQMERIANSLIDLPLKHCLVEDESPNQAIDRVSNKQGCVLIEDGHEYNYVLGNLGVYPCLQITMNEHIYGSQHWLVTVLSTYPYKTILQLRMAVPIESSACEGLDAHQISAGMVSWRKTSEYSRRDSPA